ncbi:MAG: glycosyltransferase [Candidatus Competibacteraceae bacterium]|nr:glycosyltransferase [Candidatus Competibacteraceae bacterium]
MQTKPLRVIHFVHWPASGITEVIRQIVVSCKNDNVDYSVFLLTSDEEFDSNFRWCPNRFQFFYDKKKLAAILRCLKAIRYSKPHIIHCHSISPALIACFLFRGKKVFHLHNEYPYLFENNYYYKVKRFVLDWNVLVFSYFFYMR